jgi:hypothetical protein
VLFLSAESGEGTIQETARRICDSKGIRLADVSNVAWGFWVPRARNAEQLQVLDHQISQSKAEVVVIDPLYQVLSGEDMSNLSMNGEQLQAIVQRCRQHNGTMILIDHAKRSSGNANNFQPLELSDITGAGKAEFFRQWMLIGRREPFNPDIPLHRLWLTVGGSAGHCGLFAVDIDETRETPISDRQWFVNVTKGSAARAEDFEEWAAKRMQRKEAEAAAKLAKNIQKIRDAFTSRDESWTKRKIRDHAGLSSTTDGPAIAKLIQLGELEETATKTASGTYPAYRWVVGELGHLG